MKLWRVSQLSGVEHEMDVSVSESKLLTWCEMRKDGTAPFVQDFFPELSPDEREFILTGITPEEWKSLGLEEEG